jgi:uncharacterized protein (DUF1778 family)
VLKPPSRRRSEYTLRLGQTERRLLEVAAAARSEYLGEYIRRSALEAASRELTAAHGCPTGQGASVG